MEVTREQMRQLSELGVFVDVKFVQDDTGPYEHYDGTKWRVVYYVEEE